MICPVDCTSVTTSDNYICKIHFSKVTIHEVYSVHFNHLYHIYVIVSIFFSYHLKSLSTSTCGACSFGRVHLEKERSLPIHQSRWINDWQSIRWLAIWANFPNISILKITLKKNNPEIQLEWMERKGSLLNLLLNPLFHPIH